MTEKELLLEVQQNFPICRFPFAELANRIGVCENEIIDILQKNKNDKIIRQTSAIFDTKKLGYSSSLVAFEVDAKDIENASCEINAHPGVSHNYLRSHKYNIWFTLAVAPNSKLGLTKTVEYLAKVTNAKKYLILPTLKMFKIAVKLDTTKSKKLKEEVIQKNLKNIDLTDEHYRVIEVLQRDIEFVSEPFSNAINELGMSYDRFFELFNELKDSGVMRRFASILNHKKAGFSSNAMVVWQIDANNADEIGKICASFSNVSHCYLRPVFEDWKYNLFTMIHATSEDELLGVIDAISSEIDFESNFVLHSVREFKKVRIIYFSSEFEKYESGVINAIS
jgi:DNA-binding Lrp family transcriptional regulator